MTKVHTQRQTIISPMSNSRSTLPHIEFNSDALSGSAWTEAYYASETFERGRKGTTDTQPHKPVKLSYSRRAAKEVLGDVRDKIAHIREGLLGPEERRGDNEQWIMDLAEVEAVFDDAIKKTAVEPMGTVTVALTQADLDAIALALSLSYDDQASYLQNGDPAVDYAEDLEDTKKLKATQFRGIAAVAGRLGIYTQKKRWESLAEEWESLEVDRERLRGMRRAARTEPDWQVRPLPNRRKRRGSMRFLVVSYLEEQQQVLNDFVDAPNKDAALNLLRRARPYAAVVDTLTTDELLDTAARMRNATDVPGSALAVKKLIDETPDPADWCEKCDDSVESCACREGEDR